MHLKISILLLAVGMGLQALAQQDVQFSQYVFNNLSVNPAYAGYKEDTYLSAVYRKQWAGFPGAPQTGAVSVDGIGGWGKFASAGIGGQLLWDKLGPQQSISFFGSYAYRIPLDESGNRRLCLGIGAGVTQYSLDGAALAPLDANDPNMPLGKVSSYKPDARVGIYYFTPNFFASLSVLSLFTNNLYNSDVVSGNARYSTINKTRHYYLSAGYLFKISDNVKLKPSFMMKDDFKGPTNFDFNLFALLGERLWIGGSYRSAVKLWQKNKLPAQLEQSNAASAIFEYFITDQLRAGYSYDFMVNGLSAQQKGSHEISIGLVLPRSRSFRGEHIVSPRYF